MKERNIRHHVREEECARDTDSCQRRRECKSSLTTLVLSGLGADLLVVLLEGGEILAGLGEL